MSRTGVRDTRLSARPGEILQAQWTELDRLRRVVLKRAEVEAIHDLRVTSRRMRTTLRLLVPFVSPKRARFINKSIRQVTRELGRLRNLDEAIGFFSTAAGLEELTERLAALRKRELCAVTRTLKGFSRHAVDQRVRDTVAELSAAPFAARRIPALPVYLSGVSITGFQAIHNLLTPATAPENVELRHTLRIAIKKWRYLLETIALIVDQDYSPALELLKEYQSLLGRMNDMVEFALLCDTFEFSPDYRSKIDACLNSTSEELFNRFCALVEAKPLHYTFIL